MTSIAIPPEIFGFLFQNLYFAHPVLIAFLLPDARYAGIILGGGAAWHTCGPADRSDKGCGRRRRRRCQCVSVFPGALWKLTASALAAPRPARACIHTRSRCSALTPRACQIILLPCPGS